MCSVFVIKSQRQKTVVFVAKYQLKRVTVAILNGASFHSLLALTQPYNRFVTRLLPADDTLFEVGP